MKRPGILARAAKALDDDRFHFALGVVMVGHGLQYVLTRLAADRVDNEARFEEIAGELDHARRRIGVLEGRQMARSSLERASMARHPSAGHPEPETSAEGPRAAP